MFGNRLKTLVLVAGLTIVLGCASSTVAPGGNVFQVTGTFAGLQDGVADSVSFEDEEIVFLLIERADSVTGTFDISGLKGGDFVGAFDRDDVGTFIDFNMTQIDPCPGSFTGRTEARAGVGISGNVVVALAGMYTGSDCDGDVDAAFFVQN